MLKRELKINFKNFIVWLGILCGMFLMIFFIYPTLMDEETMTLLNESLKSFPKELIKALNMDISNVSSAYGWFKTEGLTFVLLVTGLYSSILGGNILLKEENDKSIEYLNSLPVSRNKIIGTKILSGFIYIILFFLLLTLFNFIGLNIVDDLNYKQFFMLSIIPLNSALVLFSLSLFISTFFHKSKNMFGISILIVAVSYFINIISQLGDNTEIFKYFSIFTLVDVRNVIINSSINLIMSIISILLIIVFLIFSIYNYNKKEFI